MNDKIDVKEIHPDLEPVHSAPSLFSFYGFGLRLFGNRDYASETNSSVKTLFITLAYIPLIPLRAYRVVKDGGSYYFLGRVPVSKVARNGSLAAIGLGTLALAGIGTQQFLTSDSRVNGKIMAEAESAQADGQLGKAMSLYKKLYENSDHYERDARSNIRKIVTVDTLEGASTAEFANVLETLNSISVSPLNDMQEGVYELAKSRLDENDGTDNVNVHRLLHAANELNEYGEDLSSIDQILIESINKSDPTNLQAATELSEQYYMAQDYAAVKAVLDPVKDNLGDSEAARILGQVYVAEGNNKAAYPLLSGYTSSRLDTLRDAEETFNELQNSMWDTEYNRLNDGKGPQSFYDGYDLTPDDQKQIYVDDYIGEKINNNKRYQTSLEHYREAAAIVPVVMDFGILQLRTAETMGSEEARNAELSAAEKTFLSIRNIVGDTDEYKIYLGQVYFWLGKQEEGQALFDEILASNERSAESLLSIASTLRTLGKVGLATELTQEAYETSDTDEMRYAAASTMHLLADTMEDKIMWLERSDLESIYTQASLKDSKGHLALSKGNMAVAKKYFQDAIKLSQSLPDNATNYNNTALKYFSLHQITGEKEAYANGVELMSKAVELRPDESILLSNAASSLVTNSLYESLDETIDFQYLQFPPSINFLSYYYNSDVQKESLRQTLKSHADLQKAIDYYERATLLSPNDVRNYNELYSIYYFLNDEVAISDLADKMVKNQIDVSSTNKKLLDHIKGVDADKDLQRLKEREAVYIALLGKRKLNAEMSGVIHDLLVEIYLQQVSFGETGASTQAMKHAKLAVRDMPSSSSNSNYANALLSLASIEAANTFPAYKAMRDESLKSLSDGKLVVLSLHQGGEIANWLKENANIQEVVRLKAAELERFPNTTDPDDWVLFKAFGKNAQENVLVQNIQQSDLRASMQKIAEYRVPLSGLTLANRYLLNEISGGPKIDASKFDKLQAEGINLPRSLFE